MRRWVCIVAMLAGFSGSGYTWAARRPAAVPIVRVLPAGRGLPGPAWWDPA